MEQIGFVKDVGKKTKQFFSISRENMKKRGKNPTISREIGFEREKYSAVYTERSTTFSSK